MVFVRATFCPSRYTLRGWRHFYRPVERPLRPERLDRRRELTGHIAEYQKYFLYDSLVVTIKYQVLVFHVFEAGEGVALKIDRFQPIGHRTGKNNAFVIKWFVYDF